MKIGIKQVVTVFILAVLIIFSATVCTNYFSNPDIYNKQITELDEKKETVLTITGATTLTSALITVLPGDTATPIAEKLADISGYLLIVLCAIYLEKYLLVIMPVAAFRFLFPIALFFIGIWNFKRNGKFLKLAAKFAAFGVAIMIVIPVSLGVSNIIESTYESTIDSAIENAEETNETIQGISGETDTDESETEEESEGGGVLSKIANAIGDLTDTVKDAAEDVKDTISSISQTNVTEIIEMVQEEINQFLEATAVMIITCCVIPILVFVFFVWIIKVFLNIEIKDLGAIVKKEDEVQV